MEYTNNLNLKKPGYEDQADIQDINSNMDIVDQHIAELKSDLGGLSFSITENGILRVTY